MSTPLSVIIITKNEEQNIGECIESVRWADDIVVVDAESSDKTAEIAQSYSARVFTKAWEGFSAAKQFALEQTRHGWILWIDADERATLELSKEIQTIVEKNENNISGYRVARRAYFLGQRIKHCGWYPGYVVRLFRKEKATFSNNNVHEQVHIDGRIETLSHDLLHFTDNTLEHYFKKYNQYTSLSADELNKEGQRANLFDIVLRPFFTFIRMYFFKLGFLDGLRGFILCQLSASYVMTKYVKLWEKQQTARHKTKVVSSVNEQSKDKS